MLVSKIKSILPLPLTAAVAILVFAPAAFATKPGVRIADAQSLEVSQGGECVINCEVTEAECDLWCQVRGDNGNIKTIVESGPVTPGMHEVRFPATYQKQGGRPLPDGNYRVMVIVGQRTPGQKGKPDAQAGVDLTVKSS